jgi:SpoVK/Ycf46/Vps4 family AAA+-type ATPase
MEVLNDLELLILSRYPLIAVETYEEERVAEMLQRIAAKLGVPFFVWSVTRGLARVGASNPIYDTQHPLKALANVAAISHEGIYLFKDLHRYWGEVEVVRKLQELAHPFARDRRALVVVAPQVTLPPELEKLTAFYRLDLPTARELRVLAQSVIKDLSRHHTVRVELSPEEFDRLVEGMKGLTLFEAERAITKAVLRDLALTGEDVHTILETKRALLEKEGVLEYLPAEEGMGAVGGLENLKRWLAKRKKAFTPEAGRFGLSPPRGIMLLGVQGCGKTMAAKAVAREWALPLLRMEPGRLYDKFVGESEKNLEKALRMAERMAPCVLMIDEIEKGFAYVGSGDADAGLSKRIFGRLLGWLQERHEAVFVVATCNQIAALPPELMRKGRFDEIFFIDLPGSKERVEIFALHLQKRKRDPAAFDLAALAEASEGFSGAEIEQAVVSALYHAFSRGTDLDTLLLLEELKATAPLSVTREEDVAALRAWARGRTVPA